jgi:uncharacterized membrane protein
MADFEIEWKSGNRRFLIRASKIVVVAVLMALTGASLTMPTGISERFARLVGHVLPPATAPP